jgi:hypothetical protein
MPTMGAQGSNTKPAAPKVPATNPQTQPPQTVNDLITLLLPFIFQKITGQPLPGATPDVSTQNTGGSVLSKPSVQIGAAGIGLASLLQAFQFIAPPFNFPPAAGTTHPDPTVGTLATVIPLIVGALGATGGWGSLIGIASTLFNAIGNAAKKPS